MNSDEDFEAAYLKYSDKIFRFLYLHTKDPYLSEDITSEVFVRAWKNWKKFKPDYVQAWLYKIANNILIDYWRSKKNKKDVSLEETINAGMEPSYDKDFIEEIQKNEDIKVLKSAVDLLPENLKNVVILRFIEGMSAKEASEILKISEVNVRVLQYRALIKLKEKLK
ncbi:MAG: sigma-70 family RNA polymerase sigma factor [Candidatus Levybacteria bacterium]|nr:sigma-70 family RNA polymerase sigma factor [Candidatus Levybacteria bacterium]